MNPSSTIPVGTVQNALRCTIFQIDLARLLSEYLFIENIPKANSCSKHATKIDKNSDPITPMKLESSKPTYEKRNSSSCEGGM